ncbi:amidase protein [Rutstroemia sp. NJR-2017a WRK4]|nr:amidase protein [Rutstroemia sp. NJR-2017a WRK4]
MSSRNTQRESFKTPTKPRSAKKAKKTIDYSSDSSYAGVYDISDDEDNDSDDDPDVFLGAGGPVEKYEEAAMFESAEEDDDLETVEDDTDSQRTPRANDEYEEWQGIPDSSDEVLGDGGFLENISSTHDSDTYDSPKKRVTFDLSDDSDIASDDEWWPDLFDAATSRNAPFLSTDALPPGLARVLEDDRDNDDNDGSDHEVYWGNGSSDEEQVDNESDSSSSSGYESDDGGDTTDDEDWRDNRPEPVESVVRRDSPEPPSSIGMRIERRKGQPDVITWYHNTDIPFVILDEAGKDLLMFSHDVVPRLQTPGNSSSPIKNGVVGEFSPVLSNQANVMMSAMQDTPLDFSFGFGQSLSQPEAFFSGFDFNNTGYHSPTEESSYDDSDSNKPDALQWKDLLHLDETLDGDDEADDDDAIEPQSTPARPTTARSEDQVHPLLEHLDRNPVGAFRHNQQSQRLINSNTISQEALAFGTDTIRGVKNGHLESLTSSLTPRRKPKPLLPSSPAAALADRKRKSDASGDYHSHKRSRSNA